MMKMKKAMRGISLLLCLGFFAYAQNVSAQSSTALMDDYIKYANQKYRNCIQVEKKSQEVCQKEKDNYTLEQYQKDKKQAEAQGNKSQSNNQNTTNNNNTNTNNTNNTNNTTANTAPTGSPVTTKLIKVDNEQKDINKKIEKITNNIKDLGDNSDSGGCENGVAGLNTYKQKASAYIAAANEFNSAVESVTNACNKYSKIKAEYNSCLSGGKGVDVSSVRTAEQKVSQSKSAMDSAYSTAQSAVSTCKDLIKNAQKAQKTSEKADKKSEKARQKLANEASECSDQEIATGTCSAKYEEMYNNCGNDAQACKDAYKKWQKVKELEEKYNDKAQTALDANSNLSNAEQEKLNARCPGNEVWNKQLQDCVLSGVDQDDIDQCSGRGFYWSETKTCYESKAARENAKNEKAYNEKMVAYNQCLTAHNQDSSKCTDEEEAMNVAAGGLGATDIVGEDLSGKKTAEQIEAEARAAVGKGDTRCSGASLTGTVRGTYGIFDYLACKITTVVADVRVIVYILSGFGMIAFAYGAIIGKINWKQLANIGIGLFILSMATSFIEYFAYNGKSGSLPYGSYLPNGHATLGGSGDPSSAMNCSENNTDACPDAQLAELKGKADSSSFGWSDLKSALSSARDAVNTATNAYSSVKNTVETTVNAAKNITNAIGNGGNIIDIAATVGTNIENVSRSIGTTSSYLAQAGSSLSNSIQDAQMTNEQRAYVDKVRSEYEKIAKKCGADCSNSKCNSAEQNSCKNLKAEVDKYTTSVDQWLNDDGRGGGATILAGIEQTTKAVNQGAGITRDVQQAKNQGESQGERLGLGGGLSGLLGIGYAVSEGYSSGSDYVDQVSGMDYRSQQTKDAQSAAEALAKAKQICSKNGGTYNESTKKCTKGNSEIDLATGATVTTTKNADGSTTQTSVTKDEKGNTVTHKTVTNADGTTSDVVITQNEDGSTKTTITENGKTSTYETDAKGNAKVNGVSSAQQDCIEKQGGQWVDGQCVNATRVSQNEIDCKGEGGTWKDNKCSNPKKAKCEKEGGTWSPDGAKSKCLELSPEEKCTNQGKVYDANSKKCLSKEEACTAEGKVMRAGKCFEKCPYDYQVMDDNGECHTKDGDKEKPEDCGNTAKWNATSKHCECIDKTKVFSHSGKKCIDPNTGSTQTEASLQKKQDREKNKEKEECKAPRVWFDGPVIKGCLCPNNQKYDPYKNQCFEATMGK